MTHRIDTIETEAAPKPVGPYSQAVTVSMAHSSLLFVSGQLPIDPHSGTLVTDDVVAATNRVLDTIEAILQEARCGFSDILRVDIFLRDLKDFDIVNREYEKRFRNGHFPARQTVQVKLPKDAILEMSCIAVVRERT